jgi:hypothetical protein
MSYNEVGPVFFGGISNVTSSRNSRDPEVGYRRWYEGAEYVYVYNEGGSDINPGYACVINSAATGYSVTVTAATSADLVVGVVKHATLTTGDYGWVVTRGITNVEMGATSGTVAARGLIEVGAAGVFVPVSNTTGNKSPAVGQALAAIVSSASGSAYINCY